MTELRAADLFDRIELPGGVRLRNRVFVPGHTTNFGQANAPTRRHVAYHARRAYGGVGLIISEAVRVHPTSAGRHISLGSFDDSSIPAYAAVAEAVQAEGARFFAQIMHAGRQANGDATRTAAWSASPLPWSPGAHTPHAMGRGDIETIVSAFGSAARRMQRAGVDGLEVHVGHGHLLQQFLSPVTNQRDDEYGGCLNNRMRLTRRVLDATNTSAPDLPVGVRVSADEFLEGGLQPEQMIEIVGLLRSEYPLAFVHVSHSAYHGSWSLSTQMADMSFDHAPFRHHAAAFRSALPGLPVFAVCRLDSLAEAAELITAGEADLVGLARPHITDPDLVRKTMEGRSGEIRSCLACNQGCISRVEQNLPISCVVNPEVGAEDAWEILRARADTPQRRVLVVGGGPAGMEAALSACRAGHRVTLAEAADRLGGQINVAARVAGRRRLGLLVSELERDIRAADIEVRTGWHVTEADVSAPDYDDVIMATGSLPSRRAMPHGPQVLDLWEAVAALEDDERRIQKVVVLDDGGGWGGASVAEAFGSTGTEVHLVSPIAALSPHITTYSRLALVQRLAHHRVHVHLMRTANGSGPDCITLLDAVSGMSEEITGVDLVVDAGVAVAYDSLYRQIDAAADGTRPRLHIAGDANAPRTALEAVYEGRIAGAIATTEDDPTPTLISLTH